MLHFARGIVITAFMATVLLFASPGRRAAEPPVANPPKDTPRFSLSTNRTYGTSDKPRVWINYRALDHVDFRLYRVKDPVKFFKQLNDPHQIGEQEKQQVSSGYRHSPSVLDRLQSLKTSFYLSMKDYVRSQLAKTTRTNFNEKFREGQQRPLNVADFARVPLLNPDQKVRTWRQMLSPLENEYDTRFVTLGQLDAGVYLVEAVYEDLRAYTVAVVTDLNIVTKTTPQRELIVYAVDRRSGQPRGDVQVEVVKGQKTLGSGTTDGSGLLRTQVAPAPRAPEHEPQDTDPDAGSVGRDTYLIMASGHDQFAIWDLEPFFFGARDGDEEDRGPGLTSYIYTDRPVYRPAQTVYFKGILRELSPDGYKLPPGKTVNVSVVDPNDGKLIERELPLSPRGSFSGQVEITGGAPLGAYRIEVRIGETEEPQASGIFEVEEYKKPEYKVRVSSPKPYVPVGEKTKFAIEARYFFGEPVAKATVKYYIYRSRYYHFWWRNDGDDPLAMSGEGENGDEGGGYGYGNDLVRDGEGKLDANGRLEVEFEVPPPDEKEPWDYTYRLEAQVTDSARREIEGSASFVGTRGKVVAYARPERYVYYQGDDARIDVRTSDYEGHPLAANVTLKFIQRTWKRIEKNGENKWDRYEYKLEEHELSSSDVKTDDKGQGAYNWRVPITGSIYIKAIVHEGEKSIVSLGGFLWAADRNNNKGAELSFEDSESVKLVPDKQSYRPGETAHVLAMLPTDQAHLLVTTELLTVMNTQRIDAAGRAVMIDIPIEARYVPNVYLSVVYVKDGEMYSADKMLAVPARDKFLNITVVPNKQEYKPRDVASYTVVARNADGSPAPGAEVSLGVVDEAIYSIRPDTAGDIRRAFYGRQFNRVQTNFSTSYEFQGYSSDKPIKLARAKPAYQLADFKNEKQYVEPTIRKEFKDTAFWQPALLTGADGKATANVTLPDNLTTWRATARAVTADLRVGSVVSKVIARKDLILRLETPRFLTEGDTATISAVVHNYLSADKSAKIELAVTGAKLLDSAERTVNIAKQDEQRIDWRVTATNPGEVRFLAKALTDTESDGVELPLPVVPVGLRESRGGSVTLSDDNAEKTIPLELPQGVHAQARSLRIEAAPSIAGSMFGALDYLTSYPYGCTEQTMSSFLPNVVVAQALKEVKTTSIRATNNLETKVNRGLERLYDYQHQDGGWGWWKNDKTDSFMTAYVVDGLGLAQAAGYSIRDYSLNRGRTALKAILDSGKAEDGKPIDFETRAYAIYALSETGDLEARYIDDLFAHQNELQPYGRAMLALALKARNDENRGRQIAAEIEKTARLNDFDAHWESTRNRDLFFNVFNDTEATALSLKALAALTPESSLLPKAARWLVGNRTQGYCWSSTRDTAFAVYGLTAYLKLSKDLSPNYTVDVYLNGEQVLTRKVTAADATAGKTFVIEKKGAEVVSANQIRVVKHGPGVLYLSATADYFTPGDAAARDSSNLKLTREYMRLKVTERNGEAAWTVEPLSGPIRSGDVLVSRLHVEGARGRYLMIEDPIPAGCEQIERVSGINLDQTDGKWTGWYSNREFRDQKTAIFVSSFDGRSTYQYALRVQVPGEFRVAPARAQFMYQPTVQSNTASSRMVLVEKK